MNDSLFSRTSRPFLILWFGQAISLIGTGVSRFALLIFVWELTEQATAVTIAAVISQIPPIVIGVFVGTLVDRWNRKYILMASDTLAGIAIIALLIIELMGNLTLPHIYIAMLLLGISNAFQDPAYVASVTLMVPKSLYSRSSGLLTLAIYLADVVSPIIAGILLSILGLAGVLTLDILTFLFAIISIFKLKIPQPKSENKMKPSFWQETVYGFRYIFRSPSLIALTLVGVVWNMVESIGYPLIPPFILARTGGDEAILATVLSFMGLGGVIGGILASTWSGAKNRVHNILIGALLTGLLGDLLLGLGTSLPLWILGAIGVEFFIPISIGSTISIWQAKVPVDLQGRIFATRRVVARVAGIIVTIAVGPIADYVFEPAMMPDGVLAPIFSGLIEPGKGAGMGLMLVIGGILLTILAIMGYLIRPLRNIESLLTDATV